MSRLFHEPPEGWSTFGTHVDRPVRLEFSKEEDDGGMPLWERPLPDQPCDRCAFIPTPDGKCICREVGE